MVTYEELCSILEEWNSQIKIIQGFNAPNTFSYGNVNLCVDRFRNLADYLRTHLSTLREWMMTYLKENRKEIFLQFWMTHIQRWMKGHIHNIQRETLHPRAEEEWNRIFGSIFPFSIALQRVQDLQAILPIEKCDDVVIKNMHKGKSCSNWDYYCDLCEDQEYCWKSELERRIMNSQHPLLSGVFNHYQKKDLLSALEETWEPPHMWGWSHDNKPIYDLDKYKQDIYFKTLKHQIHTSGLTPIQRLRPYYYTLLNRRGWHIPQLSLKNPIDVFFELWNTLDITMYSIQIDLPNIIDLEVEYVECGKSKPHFIHTS